MIITLLTALAMAQERRLAVVIGADHGDADEATLSWAEQDARRVSEVLTGLGGVAPDDLVHLEGARADEVRAVLQRTAARLQGGARPTLLLVYASGHADASSLHLNGTRLLLSELQDLVDAVQVDARVLIFDACRAGELTRARGATTVQPFEIVVQDRLASRGTAILTAGAAGEDAQESDRLAGGVFTHHLLAGLRGAADTSGDLAVSLDEIYRYTYERTVATTATAPMLQHPSFAFDLTGQREVLLTSLDRDHRDGTVRFELAGDYLVFDASGREVRYDLAVPAGGVMSMRPGRYIVRRRTPEALWEGEVEVAEGMSTVLSDGDLALLPFGQATRRGGEDTNRRSSVALYGGGGVSGPTLPGLGPVGMGGVGVRVDLPAVTLRFDAHGGRASAANSDLSIGTTTGGASVQLLRLFDGGPVSFGPGLTVGLDGVFQRFDTEGLAPARGALTGRVGAIARLEVSLHPRATLGIQGALDAVLMRGAERAIQASTVPSGTLDLTVWLAQGARARRDAGVR